MIYIYIISFIVSNAFHNHLVISNNQNWHYTQLLNIGFLLFVGYLKDNNKRFLLNIISFALIYPFSFNSLLNFFRGLPISYLGQFDFLSFPVTIVLFVIGICVMLFDLIQNEFQYYE